ncbi:flagellar motor switch protein FliN [Candidatus Latescibacterota bacterium]
MVAENDKNSVENVEDEEIQSVEAVEEEDDLEAQMAASMADGMSEDGEDDLEAQMATAMSSETEDDLEKQMAEVMDEKVSDIDDSVMSTLYGEEEAVQEAEVPVQETQFQQLRPSDESAGKDNIDRLLDVSLNLSVELGRKQIQIKEILGLGPGKIIELDKLAGEPVDLLVNGKLLAKGEVVVVDENFGIRITDLITPKDRVKSLL